MPNQKPAEQDETLITLEGDDGHSYSCQLIDVFEFEKQEYALLLKTPEEDQGTNGTNKESKKTKKDEPEEGSLVVMRLVQREDQCIFQTIEDDQEFERVISYIEELAQESLNETTDQIAKSEQA
jgi:hypothetical protein